MDDKLEKHLIDIAKYLGWDKDLPKDYDEIDKLDWHLKNIESLIQGGSKPSVSPLLTIDYTLDDLLQYKNMETQDIPSELRTAIEDVVVPQIEFLDGLTTYAELYTKDGSCFKGALAFFDYARFESYQAQMTMRCVTDDNIVYLMLGVETDAETGDSRLIFYTIGTYR